MEFTINKEDYNQMISERILSYSFYHYHYYSVEHCSKYNYEYHLINITFWTKKYLIIININTWLLNILNIFFRKH